MTVIERPALCGKSVADVDKVGILLLGEVSSLFALVGHAEVGEHALGNQSGQVARLTYFFYRIIVAWELLTHEAYAAHAGVRLDVDFAGAVRLFALSRETPRVIKRENRLADVVFTQLCRVADGSVAENQNRQLYTRVADLDTLVNVGYREKVRAERFVKLRELGGAVTVAICLDHTAQLCAVCFAAYLSEIMRNGVE